MSSVRILLIVLAIWGVCGLVVYPTQNTIETTIDKVKCWYDGNARITMCKIGNITIPVDQVLVKGNKVLLIDYQLITPYVWKTMGVLILALILFLALLYWLVSEAEKVDKEVDA